METLARSYKYRLYPTPEQEQMLSDWQFACWEVQRVCIIQRRAAWERYKISRVGTLPSWASQGREVTELRREYAHLAAVPADTMSAVTKRVDDAYKRMRDSFKTGKPATVRWAKRPSEVGLPFRGQPERGTRLVHANGRFGWWRLAAAGSLGPLKVRTHRPLPDGAEVKQAHITCAADGWYISFSCVIPAPEPPLPAAKAVNGVDLNVKHDKDDQEIAAVDDGRKYKTTDGLKRNAKRLATLQKLVSPTRRTKGTAKAADPRSKRTAKRRARIARLHQRIARQREHVQQYVARRLVDTANMTAFEDLSHNAMRRKGKGRRKRGLNRALSTAAPAALVKLTEEKAEAAGRTVVKVNARNTTQTCSACGVIGERKGLNVRRWMCDACGAEHDRDVNAARNIAARAMNVEPACSGGLSGEGAAPVGRKTLSANLEDRKRSGGEKRRRPSQKREPLQLSLDLAAD